MYRKSYCTIPGIGIAFSGGDISKMYKSLRSVFIMMGWELAGELSCTWTGFV